LTAIDINVIAAAKIAFQSISYKLTFLNATETQQKPSAVSQSKLLRHI